MFSSRDESGDLNRFLQFLDTLPIPMIVGHITASTDKGIRPWRTIFHNQRFLQVVGYTVEEIGDGERWYLAAYPDPIYRAERMAQVAAQADGACEQPDKAFVASNVRIRCKDGQDRWFEVSKNYQTILAGNLFVTAMTDVTALHNLQVEIEQLARTDELTGLPNRRAIQVELASAQARMLRNGQPFTCVIADIDHFKNVNDAFGHDCGDMVLFEVAQVLKRAQRAADQVGRWGGEEFCMLLCDTDASDALALIDRLRELLAAHPLQCNGSSLAVTMTFGVTVHRTGESVDETLRRADAAMYAGKRAGRDRVVVAD